MIGAAGLADALSVVELGGDIGTVQAHGWRYGFAQVRVRRDRFFANVFYNLSNSGQSYELRNSLPLVDSSRVAVMQIQHGRHVGPVDLLYGADARWTDPRTGGTIDGEHESHDRMFEFGAYTQATAALSPRVDAVAALRVDHHSALHDGVVSPRLGIVFHAAPTHTFRVTFNRGFTSPDANTLFIDALQDSAGVYGIRVGGVPRDGFTFRRDCGGSLCGFSPLDPSGAHAVTTAGLWPALQNFASARGIDISSVPVPTSAQVGVGLIADGQLVSASDITDVAPLRRTITTAFEVGWKGQVSRRLNMTVDWFANRLTNVVGVRYVSTPLAFYDSTSLHAWLSPYLPAAAVDTLAKYAAKLPMAVVSPRETSHAYDLVVLSRQGGAYTLWGIDVGTDVMVSNRLTLRGSLSWLNRNTATDAAGTFVLGVPRRKAAVAFAWRDDPRRLGFGASVRMVEGFDVNSGPYVGHVRGYGIVDAHLDVAVPFMPRTTFALEAQNLFDNRHQEFVGAPALGRLILTRIRTEL